MDKSKIPVVCLCECVFGVCVCVCGCACPLLLSVCGHKAARKFQHTWHADQLQATSYQLPVVFAFATANRQSCHPARLFVRAGTWAVRSVWFLCSLYNCSLFSSSLFFLAFFPQLNNENSRCTIFRGGHRCCYTLLQ